MNFKDRWIPQNDTMDADASVVNMIADEVIRIGKNQSVGNIPTKISDLVDDTNENPIKRSETTEEADYAYIAAQCDKAEHDMNGYVFHEFYASKDELGTVESIAKGRATGYVFDTVEDMNAWLENPNNYSLLVLGDNLYIRATNVPDYWWDGSAAQPLETQKVDLTEYVKNTDYATADKAGVVKVVKNSEYGVKIYDNNVIGIAAATQKDIQNKVAQNRPITPHRLEYAVEVCTNQDINAELTEAQLKLPPSTQTVKDSIGDIDKALERIIAIQNELMGVSE